jgi:hypothetical protein
MNTKLVVRKIGMYYWICIWSILFDFYGMAKFLIEEKMAATKKNLLDSYCHWLKQQLGAVCSLGHIQPTSGAILTSVIFKSRSINPGIVSCILIRCACTDDKNFEKIQCFWFWPPGGQAKNQTGPKFCLWVTKFWVNSSSGYKTCCANRWRRRLTTHDCIGSPGEPKRCRLSRSSHTERVNIVYFQTVHMWHVIVFAGVGQIWHYFANIFGGFMVQRMTSAKGLNDDSI